MIMDESNKYNNGFYLYTQCFTKIEIKLLVKILKVNFNLNCTINKAKNPIINIRISSIDKLKFFISPYFHNFMLYKLRD